MSAAVDAAGLARMLYGSVATQLVTVYCDVHGLTAAMHNCIVKVFVYIMITKHDLFTESVRLFF